jgi:molybdate transport system permease protein
LWFDVDGASLWLAFSVAATSTAVALVLGVALAFALDRWRSRAKLVVEALLLWPLVLPTTVLGYFLLVLFARDSAFGRAVESLTGAPLAYTPRAATVAACVTALPLVLRATQRALSAVDRSLLFAARSLGASEWYIARTITAPLITREIVAVSLLVFARTLGEFALTLMLLASLPEARNASIVALDVERLGQRSHSGALALVLAGFSLGAALLIQWLGSARPGPTEENQGSDAR